MPICCRNLCNDTGCSFKGELIVSILLSFFTVRHLEHVPELLEFIYANIKSRNRSSLYASLFPQRSLPGPGIWNSN